MISRAASDCSIPDKTGSATVESENGRIRLQPELAHEAEVAIWSARRNADLLAQAIDRELEIAAPS